MMLGRGVYAVYVFLAFLENSASMKVVVRLDGSRRVALYRKAKAWRKKYSGGTERMQ